MLVSMPSLIAPFRDANRVSGGLEYVSGLNEVRANVYRGLGSVKSQSDMIHLPPSYFTFDLDGGPAYYMPHTSQKGIIWI